MDVFVTLALPVLGFFLSVIFNFNFVASTFLLFVAPSIYLSLKRPVLIKKSLIFSLVMGITALFILDYMAYADFTWFVPNSVWRFLDNAIPIEDGFWVVAWMYYVTIWYEYFLNKNAGKLSSNFRYLILILFLLLFGFFGFYYGYRDFLMQRYFFVKLGVVFIIIPMFLVLRRFPKLIWRLVPLGIYFFFVSYLMEYVGLRNFHWYFGGKNYIGTTTLAGQILAYDEIIFLWVLGAPGIICWYKYFTDDVKIKR